MIKAVVAFAMSAANIGVTKSIAAFEAIMNMLIANLTAIANIKKIASDPVTGYASQKLALKNTLAEFSAAIMQSVASYALSQNDQVLLKKVQTSRSALLGMTYEGLVSYIGAAIGTVNAIVADLSGYNINAATITLWQTNLSQLQAAMSNPKNEHSNQNTAKQDIQSLLKTSMEMLYNQADQIAEQFKAKNMSYYTNYKYNRKLYPNSRHTTFKITVTDELKQPIAEVTVSQDKAANTSQTDINGQASLRIKVEAGKNPMYEFTISKGSQQIKTGLIEIKKGEAVTKAYIMQPSGFIIPAPVTDNSNIPA